MATKTLEVFLAVDTDGDWQSGTDQDDAVSNYANAIGSLVTRVVKINVTLTLPEVQEASATVPDEASQTVAAEVAT